MLILSFSEKNKNVDTHLIARNGYINIEERKYGRGSQIFTPHFHSLFFPAIPLINV